MRMARLILIAALILAGQVPARAGTPSGQRILTFRTAPESESEDPLLDKLAHQLASADLWLARMKRMGQRPANLPPAAPQLAEAPVPRAARSLGSRMPRLEARATGDEEPRPSFDAVVRNLEDSLDAPTRRQ
jgi:hypothetical protein